MMSISYPWPTATYRSCRLDNNEFSDRDVRDRQDRVPGFSTDDLAKSAVLQIGADGLGSAISSGLTRKGIGRLDICDPDVVEPSNLTRQSFFKADLFEAKALALAKHAAAEGHLGSIVCGHQVGFTNKSARRLAEEIDVTICGVDNNPTRALAVRFCRREGIPVIFVSVSEDASYGYVFVQEPMGPCLACVFPRVAMSSGRQTCPPVPAVLDILRVVGGLTLYAVDSLLTKRARHWDFRSVNLAGGSPDVVCRVLQRAGCPLCEKSGGNKEREDEATPTGWPARRPIARAGA